MEFSEEDIMYLWYDPKINRFIDEMGQVVHDIFRFVTPSQVRIFRQYRGCYVIPDRTNSFLVQMEYPEPEDICDLDYY